MTTDFSSLVLAPCMAVFAPPITITPIISNPSNPAPYPARGVFTVQQTDLPTEDGGIFNMTTLKFGIRLAEFPLMPAQGDWITANAADIPMGYWQGSIVPTGEIDFIIDKINGDGQGGAALIVKRVTP